jgi:ubiquinone/menaquinone biosynthesis C-methylase UbiE
LTPSPADLWGAAEYRQLAGRLAPVHDELVERLAIQPGERVLDVATGTGEVAIRAARRGAEVTGVDIAPRMLDVARDASAGLSIRFDAGDVQNLPYADASFDVVVSCFGAIFGRDHAAVARELARVTRTGGRLALTAWRPNAGFAELYRRFGVESPEGPEPFRWGADGYAEERLGDSFAFTIDPRTWFLEGAGGEELWELWSTSAPPFKAMVDAMDDDQREAFRRAYVAFCEEFREDGAVRVPREYLLILGMRR